jgi:ABC-2 type transport system ATP-binding protein
MASGEVMIECQGLTKRYGAIQALDDVSFHVNRGEVLGFLGPNGAGKTTTMKILTCFIAPTKGQASVAGLDIFKDPLEVRRKVGYLPENAPLYPEMRVGEYLDFVGEIRALDGKARADGKRRVIDECGLTDVVEQEIRTLSKGFRQRAGLAQAMLHNPELLILDEPTSGLDPNQIAEIRGLVKAIGRERTVILSTHNLAEVQATAQRVVIIHQGKLVADGTPEELEKQRGGAVYDVVLADPDGGFDPVREAFSAIAGISVVEQERAEAASEMAVSVRGESDQDVRADIFRAAVDKGWILLGLGRKQVDLEGIFRRLTKSGERSGERAGEAK